MEWSSIFSIVIGVSVIFGIFDILILEVGLGGRLDDQIAAIALVAPRI